jgi:hypothetical protein
VLHINSTRSINEARHRMTRIIDDALQLEGQHLKVLHINLMRSLNEAHHR